MARLTHSEMLARKDAQIASAETKAVDALRERDDALAESARLKREMVATTCTGADDKLRARLAVIMFPDLCEKDVGPDDLITAALEYGKMIDIIHTMSARPLTEVGQCEPLELLDEIHTELRKGEDAIENFDSLPSDWGDWAEFVKHTSLVPEDIESMAELLELLGLSGSRLAAVLASPDMEGALKRY